MRIEEAQWIRDQLAQLQEISPVLELGSSTLDFRTRKRPHIDALLHAPMRSRGVTIIHSDFKQDEGVDVAGDIFDPSIQNELRRRQPRTILCCNLLEHVSDRAAVAQFCTDLLPAGGYLVFTGPFSYPVHLDPIDNYFRPTPEEVAALFDNFEIIRSDLVPSKGFGAELLERPSQIPLKMLRAVYGLLKFWVPRSRYVSTNHRLLWLFRPYAICCVVLRKRHRADKD